MPTIWVVFRLAYSGVVKYVQHCAIYDIYPKPKAVLPSILHWIFVVCIKYMNNGSMIAQPISPINLLQNSVGENANPF